jgi:Fur family transcriptional regulator, stress-responsive regulator
MQPVPALIELFRRNGYRITPQRRAIFELLSGDESHPTAESVFQRALAVLPDISRTTVYNTMKELAELGELVSLDELSEEGLRYDTDTGDHQHLFCLKCNILLDLREEFPGMDLSPEEVSGFRIVRRQVTFYGYCPDCQ